MVGSLKVHVRQAWLSETLAQNVGALSRFSSGISVSFPEGQKEMPLTTQHRPPPQGLDCLRQQLPGETRKVSLSTKATTMLILRDEALFRKALRVPSKAVVAQARATQSERFIRQCL